MIIRTISSPIKVVVAATMLFISMQALAATAAVDNALVNRILLTADKDPSNTANTMYGGCMIALNPAPTANACAALGGGYVALDCTGATDPVLTYRMLDQAQLALSTGKFVYVTYTNDKKINGYCLATRIDIKK